MFIMSVAEKLLLANPKKGLVKEAFILLQIITVYTLPIGKDDIAV